MKQSAERKLRYSHLLIVFLLICGVIGTICFQYYHRLQHTIRDESSGYLQEVARRVGDNVGQIISDNYAVLNTMESVFTTMAADSFDQVRPVVETQKSYWNYDNIMFIDTSGTAYDYHGDRVVLSTNSALQETLLNKKASMSTTQIINNQERILFSIPLEDMVIGGRTMVALSASYDPATFYKVLSMSAFNDEAYCQIISKSGTAILRSNVESTIKTGYNILSSLDGVQMDPGSSLENLRKDLAADEAGQIGFTVDGVRQYMVYTPLPSQDWYLLTFVPASAVNARSDMLLRTTLIICGFITLVFAMLVVFLFYTFTSHKRKLEQIAYVDPVTSGNTIQRFYELAQLALAVPDRPQYALVYSNLAKFKVLNAQFGHSTCDTMLWAFNHIIGSGLVAPECMGRQSADNFCLLLTYEGESALLERLESWFDQGCQFVRDSNQPWTLPVTEFGIYIIENDTFPLPEMIDRAKLSLRETPHTINSKMRYAIYDDVVRRRLFREKQLEDMMEDALRQNEFQVYLQPKYRVDDETIGGAEALTRWVSASEGMIFPDEFIPLFEKNGFIVQLDLWVFEQVCLSLRAWLDQGLQPVKISVNCSRIHLKDADFLLAYRRLVEKYQIPIGLLEIELTESVVMEDVQNLTKVINDIHDAGFGCSMDDFGSGYSSLNLLQSIPVDTLKLDKIFFRGTDADSDRMESVVGSIVTMARALSLHTVAEGVEHREQVEMLRRVGCDLIQGYVFAKPMPLAAFEALAFGTITQQ